MDFSLSTMQILAVVITIVPLTTGAREKVVDFLRFSPQNEFCF